MVGKEYLTRQAATLLQFAKTTSDPNVAAGLIDKAVQLQSKADVSPPHAPHIERNEPS
jgi:hypothetical protein